MNKSKITFAESWPTMINALFPIIFYSKYLCFFQRCFFLLRRFSLWLYRPCPRYALQAQIQGFDFLKLQTPKHIINLQTNSKTMRPNKSQISLKPPFGQKKSTDNHLRFFALGFILRLSGLQNISLGGAADVNVRELGSAFKRRQSYTSPLIKNHIYFREKYNRLALLFTYENFCSMIDIIKNFYSRKLEGK